MDVLRLGMSCPQDETFLPAHQHRKTCSPTVYNGYFPEGTQIETHLSIGSTPLSWVPSSSLYLPALLPYKTPSSDSQHSYYHISLCLIQTAPPSSILSHTIDMTQVAESSVSHQQGQHCSDPRAPRTPWYPVRGQGTDDNSYNYMS